MKKFKLISILFSFSCIFLNAQSGCFEIESILVNSCSFGNEEGRNEMLRFRVGNTPLSTNDMTVAWANTNLPWNGLIQDASTAQATAAFNSEIVSCGLLKEPTNGILPANSRVLLITSNEVSTTVGFFEQLGDTLYVIYANDNTIAGHFLNYLPNPSPNIQTTVISFGSIAGCSDQVSYFRTQLITTASNIGDEDGATVNFTNNGIPAYSNIGCFISPLQTASITALPTICFGTATSITFTGTPYAVVTYTVNGGSDQTITLNGSGLANLSTGLLYENTMYELLNISSSDSPVCTQSFSGSALVTVSPIPTASYTGTTTICSNQTTAVVLSSSFSGTTYAWTVLQTGVLGASNGSGSSIAQTLTNDGSVSGLVVYTVTPTTNGCTGTTTTIPVTVNPLPVANSSGTSPICSGPVLATANSPSIQLISNLGAGTTFNWTGSDGISGSSNIISYSIPNNLCTDRTILYTVTPTFNGCVGSAISIPLTVHPNPIAAFTVSASTISQNSTVTVTFTGSACPTSNYFWTWPAGSIVIGSGAGPYSVTFPNSGNYSIDLSLSNPGGFCAAQTFSLPISVSASATATASAGSDVTICSGSTINLAGIIGGNATSATWSAPSGTFSNVNSLTSTYTPSISSGVVQLTLTTNDPDGAGPNSPAVSSLNVTVNLAASISAGANQTICTGNTASLSGFFAGSASLATWSATSGTFNNVNLNNAIFTPPANASGSYLLTYTSNDPAGVCPAVSSTVTVTVNPFPTATITAAGSTTFCAGANVVLNANTGTGLSYQWKLNGMNISGATAASYTATAAGSYTVLVTNASSCSATSSATTVTVNQFPTATITAVGSTTFCAGANVVLNANTGTGLSYQWKLNGNNISGATAASYTATAAGSYTVVVTNTSTCSATSSATTVTVNPLPTVTLTSLPAFVNIQTPSVALNGAPAGGSYSGQGISGTNFIPSAAGLGQAVVSYSYTSTAGCSGNIVKNTIVYDTSGTVCTSYDTIYTSINDTVLVSVQDTLIIETLILGSNPVQSNEIKVYPNPAHSFLEIDNGNFALMGGYSIRIENSLGQIVFNQAVNQQIFSINLSTWTGDGVYYLHIINSNGITQEIKKIVLQ